MQVEPVCRTSTTFEAIRKDLCVDFIRNAEVLKRKYLVVSMQLPTVRKQHQTSMSFEQCTGANSAPCGSEASAGGRWEDRVHDCEPDLESRAPGPCGPKNRGHVSKSVETCMVSLSP